MNHPKTLSEPDSDLAQRLKALGKLIDSVHADLVGGAPARSTFDRLRDAEERCWDMQWLITWGEPYSVYLARQREALR